MHHIKPNTLAHRLVGVDINYDHIVKAWLSIPSSCSETSTGGYLLICNLGHEHASLLTYRASNLLLVLVLSYVK